MLKRKFGHYRPERKYKNPFFSKEKRGSRGREKIIFRLLALLIFSSLSGAVWFLFASNFFAITDITLSGQGAVSGEEIKNAAKEIINGRKLFFFKQSNFLLLNKSGLESGLNSRFYFSSLEINKNLPRSLEIKYEGKRQAAIWLEDGRYYYIDTSGNIIAETTLKEEEKILYPLIENRLEEKISERRTANEGERIAAAVEIFSKLNGREGVVIDRFFLDNERDSLKAVVLPGAEIYFNIKEGLDEQINKFLALITQTLRNYGEKEYIDLRYGDKIYFK